MCVSTCLRVFPYRTEKDKAPPSPYLTINDKGDVEVQNDQVLVSTCRMHIYQFPFDTQSCNLSFKSIIHTGESVMSCVYKSLLWHELKFGAARDRPHVTGYVAPVIHMWLMPVHFRIHSFLVTLPKTTIYQCNQFFYLLPQSRTFSSLQATTLQRPQSGLVTWCGPSTNGCSSTWQLPPRTPVIWKNRTSSFTLYV